MTGRILSEQRRVEVEQCIARGWSTKHIAKVVGCTQTDVEKVRLRMDAINEQPDTILPSRSKGLEAVAAEETAAIYSGLVEESNSHAKRLAEGWTQWERHRLAVATLNLRRKAREAERDTA